MGENSTMRPTEKYIITKDGIIKGIFHTSSGIKGVEDSAVYKNIDYDKIEKVPLEFEGKTRQHINEFDKNYKLKLLSVRVNAGYVTIPEGHKLKDNEIIPMTKQEKVESGLEELDPMYKVIDNDVIPKTEEELIKDGVKTRKQIDDEKQRIADEKLIYEEMRKMAIANLGDKLKVVKA